MKRSIRQPLSRSKSLTWRVQRAIILLAIAKYGTREKAAERLNMSIRTLTDRLRSYGVPPKAQVTVTYADMGLLEEVASEFSFQLTPANASAA